MSGSLEESVFLLCRTVFHAFLFETPVPAFVIFLNFLHGFKRLSCTSYFHDYVDNRNKLSCLTTVFWNLTLSEGILDEKK